MLEGESYQYVKTDARRRTQKRNKNEPGVGCGVGSGVGWGVGSGVGCGVG